MGQLWPKGGGTSSPGGVTSLPANPTDGQEVHYIADATNGIVWHLRYRAASPSAYKWEYLGGPPIMHRVDTDEGASSDAYADLATVGPTLTVPLAGDYDLETGASMSNTGAAYCFASPSIGGGAPSDSDRIEVFGDGSTNVSNATRRIRKTGLAASNVVKLQYKRNTSAGATSYNARFRFLAITPVRVG